MTDKIEKPKPKRKIVVKFLANNYLHISYATADAKQWLQDEASSYGVLTPLADQPAMHMLVYGFYDPGEIAKYLEEGYRQT